MAECTIIPFPTRLTGADVEHVYSLTPSLLVKLTPRAAAAFGFLARCEFEDNGTLTADSLILDALVHHAKARGQEQGPD